jgi:diacylglycerol kinase (ATP)
MHCLMETLVIINPAAGGGRVGRKWPRIETELRGSLGAFEHAITKPGLGAQAIAAEAARKGFQRVIAVGGDGTVNEVINGLAEGTDDRAIAPSFGLASLGTGNDFARALGLHGGLKAAIGALRAGHTRDVDLGHMQFIGNNGQQQSRWFCNVANIGLVGEVTRATQNSRLVKLVGGRLAYPLKAISVLRHYGGREIMIERDEQSPVTLDVLSIAIANGPYFGSGMKIAPHAALADGLLDVIVIAREPKVKATDIALLYKGQHLSHPAVTHFKARKLLFKSADGQSVLCDADGELFGCLPCKVEVHPRKLRVIA